VVASLERGSSFFRFVVVERRFEKREKNPPLSFLSLLCPFSPSPADETTTGRRLG